MPDTNNENWNFWKIILYAVGAGLGIGAKLATMHRKKNLTWSEAIVETTVALASSFLVWAFFHFVVKDDNMATVVAVLAGRFADDILNSAYEKLKGWVSKDEKK